MTSVLSFAFLLLQTTAALQLAASDKFVHIPVTRQKAQAGESLRRRAGPISVTLGNADVLYYANVTVGTPAQFIQLQVDTGSSDVWMTSSSAAYCKQSRYNCEGGTFNSATSTTYKAISTGPIFNISYVDGSGSVGRFFTDDFTIGGSTIQNLQMGLATTTTIGTGIIGVCFAADESVCSGATTCQTYPNIMTDMVSQDLISSQAYSLWLDDVDAQTGVILFGGVDTAKFTGSLITIPIQKDAYSGAYTSFSVAFTGLSVTNSSGTTSFTASEYAEPAILDSGTSLTVCLSPHCIAVHNTNSLPQLLPNQVFDAVTANIDLEYSQEGEVYIAPCSASSTTTTYNFQFGGANGPVIKVPSSEFFTPISNYETSSGAAGCEFGILPAGDVPTLFGDTFLRSAYVVYDLDNKEISMAQTNFNAAGSNVVAIQAGSQGVPEVSGTVTGVSVAQTATAAVSRSYGVAASITGTATGTATVTAAAVSGTTTKTGAAAVLQNPAASITGLVVLALGSMFALLGSCFIFM